MPMKCVVCGQLTDAEKRNAELQASLNEATTRVGEYREALGVSRAEIDLLRASKAEVETFVVDLRARVFESERALARIKELLETLPAPTGHLLAQIYEIARLAPAQPAEHRRGSSTDRAPGRNPGDAGSSPAPSTPDEDKHG